MASLFRLLALTLWAFAFEASAQSSPPPAPTATQQLLKTEELDQLMAPIALYSDALLANVLMASTYPLEVVEADRWAKANKNLKGDKLKAEVAKQRWDDSVKQLVATPSVLDMMSAKLDWTQKLGDAVLAQQADVMDAVQRLRTKAEAQNTLKTTKEQTVSKKTEQGKQVIVIEPSEPNTVYVPYYDPSTAYGTWPYSSYPPYSYPQPGYFPGAVLGGALAFGAGVAVGAAWGGGFGWGNNNINVNRNVDINNVRNFQHNPAHRGGVRYNNANVAQQFGKADRAGAQQRMDFRGSSGEQVVRPGGDRQGAGDRGPGGDRAGAGDRKGGDRAGAGDRKGGDRAGAGDRKGGDRQGAGDRGGQRPGGGREGGLGNVDHGRSAMAHADRGRASAGGHPGGGARMGGAPGGGARMGGGGGGGFRGGGGGGGRGGGGGGRRSDVALKHDVVLLGTLDNGLGFYRFAYHGSDKAYVGVMAQEVLAVMPEAVVQGRDGYLRVRYENLGLKFETYEQWSSSGARLPAVAPGRAW